MGEAEGAIHGQWQDRRWARGWRRVLQGLGMRAVDFSGQGNEPGTRQPAIAGVRTDACAYCPPPT